MEFYGIVGSRGVSFRIGGKEGERTTSFSHERATVRLRYASCLSASSGLPTMHLPVSLHGYLVDCIDAALAFNDSWNDLHQRFLSIPIFVIRAAYAFIFFPLTFSSSFFFRLLSRISTTFHSIFSNNSFLPSFFCKQCRRRDDKIG